LKINGKNDYHGAPLVKVRDLLRKNPSGFGETLLLQNFGEPGQGILKAMLKDGYIARDPIRAGEFELTARGRQLANATAARKVKRATAVRSLLRMLERVGEVNEDPEFLFRIADIKVFGNFLKDVESLSDVDLCVHLMPKYIDYVLEEKSKSQVIEEKNKGRRFQNIRDEVSWPRRRVLAHLRAGGRSLSIIDDEGPLLEDAEWDYLYRIETGTNEDRFPELKKQKA